LYKKCGPFFNKEYRYVGLGGIFVLLSESNTTPARLINRYGYFMKSIQYTILHSITSN